VPSRPPPLALGASHGRKVTSPCSLTASDDLDIPGDRFDSGDRLSSE